MMKYLVAAAAAIISIVPSMAAVTFDTPFNVVQCQPQLLNYRGTSPFWVSIIPGGQPNATPLRTFPRQSDESMTILTDFPAGTSITFAVKDATGATGYTDVVVVQPGSDSSCLGSAAVQAQPANGSTTKPSPQGPAPPSSTPPTKSGSGAVGTGPASFNQPMLTMSTTRPFGGIQAVSSTSSSALAAPTLPATSGAGSRFAISSFGLAAVLGLFGAFLL